jgi:hypothetical protein
MLPPDAVREKISPDQQWLDRIASRAMALLKESPNPQQEIAWAEERLSEESLLGWGTPDRKNLFAWTQEVIAQNWDLMDDSVPWLKERDSHPEEAETFEE